MSSFMGRCLQTIRVIHSAQQPRITAMSPVPEPAGLMAVFLVVAALVVVFSAVVVSVILLFQYRNFHQHQEEVYQIRLAWFFCQIWRAGGRARWCGCLGAPRKRNVRRTDRGGHSRIIECTPRGSRSLKWTRVGSDGGLESSLQRHQQRSNDDEEQDEPEVSLVALWQRRAMLHQQRNPETLRQSS